MVIHTNCAEVGRGVREREGAPACRGFSPWRVPATTRCCILGKAGLKAGVLRSDGTQEMGYRWRWDGGGAPWTPAGVDLQGARGLHEGGEKRKEECHPPAALWVHTAPSTRNFLLVMNVLSQPMATRDVVGMRPKQESSVLLEGRLGWAHQILFQQLCPVHYSIMSIFKLENKKDHGTRDHDLLVQFTIYLAMWVQMRHFGFL